MLIFVSKKNFYGFLLIVRQFMKIYPNYYTNNIQFYGHRVKYTNEQLSAILDPLFEQKLPFNEIMSVSGLSHNVINKWAKETKGKTANKLYYQHVQEYLHDDVFEKKLRELRKSGLTCEEIGKIFKRSRSWIGMQLKNFNKIGRAHV